MMETDRFEAFIDAILAIIITIIVLEIPLASSGSWEALYELRYEFIIYAVSFIVCFNFWNYNNNLFSIVNKIDYKVIWTMGITLFVFSLLPYLTTFVAENFYINLQHALCVGAAAGSGMAYQGIAHRGVPWELSAVDAHLRAVIAQNGSGDIGI